MATKHGCTEVRKSELCLNLCLTLHKLPPCRKALLSKVKDIRDLGSTQPCPLRCLPESCNRSSGEKCLVLGVALPSTTFLGPHSYKVDTLKGASLGVQHHQSVSQSLRSQSLPFTVWRETEQHNHLPAICYSTNVPVFTKHNHKKLGRENVHVTYKFCQYDDEGLLV